MFTPPPSPLPKANDPLAESESEKHDPNGSPKDRPARLSRRQRFFGLVVPVVVLVLITLTSRHAAGPLDTNPSNAPAPRSPGHRVANHHVPRQLGTTDPADQVPSPTATTSAPDTTTPQQLGAGSSTVPAIPNPPWPVPTPFPQPFDSSLSFNFSTSTCSSFFSDFTTNMTFRACRPFSLLLGTSTQFFNIESNLTELTAVMAGTCDTPRTLDDCRTTMNWLATEIVKPTVCAKEISNQNSAVLQALDGFKTYDLMRQAGCLVNQRSNAYCFVESVASASPVDTYFYTLPLGTPIPQKSTPSCSACTKSLMSLYAEYATDTTLPLSKVYSSAQKMANSACGADYAQAVANAASPRAVVTSASSLLLLGATLGLLMDVW